MGNIGVLAAGRRGWPHKGAWFNLGRWGMTVNVLAIAWGAIGLANIALWQADVFGDFGSAGRAFWNPFIDTFFTPFGQKLSWMPHWPLFETMIGVLLAFGALYYLLSVRGRAHDVEGSDPTGEMIA